VINKNLLEGNYNDQINSNIINIVENANSDKINKEIQDDEIQPCIAVHCIAGLGRYFY